ncbi:MAG: hypothetical protein ACK4LQ_13745 [Pararhodobacter sp.]
MKPRHPGLLRETAGLFGAGAVLVLPACLGFVLLAGLGDAVGASERTQPPANAQPVAARAPDAGTPADQAALGRDAQAEVRAALRSMSADELRLTAQRIHAAFRIQLGAPDLRPARALIDYATLAEQELGARGLPWPDNLPDTAQMRQLFELVL